MTSVGSRMTECLGPIRVINLASRPDRRREFNAQLARIGLGFDHPQVAIFDAIRPDSLAGFPTLGTRGCFLSQLDVLRQARDDGLPGFILCEDDLDFSSDFERRAPAVLAALSTRDWDIFYGGFDAAAHGLAADDGLLRLDPALPVLCCHFMAFRRAAIEALVPYLTAITQREVGDPAGGPMHVDGAYSHFRADHPAMVTLAVSPTLGVQRASRTDIHELRWFDRLPVLRDVTQIGRRLRRALR
ncbi:glycosyl transferase family 25 [Roseovarius sp. MBR-154]